MTLAMAEPRYAQKKAGEEKAVKFSHIATVPPIQTVKAFNQSCDTETRGPQLALQCELTTGDCQQVYLPGESVEHPSNSDAG